MEGHQTKRGDENGHGGLSEEGVEGEGEMIEQPRVSDEDFSLICDFAAKEAAKGDASTFQLIAFDLRDARATIAEQAAEIADLKSTLEHECEISNERYQEMLAETARADRAEAELAALRAAPTDAPKGGDALSNPPLIQPQAETRTFSPAPEVHASGATDAQREQDVATVRELINLWITMKLGRDLAHAALNRLAALPLGDARKDRGKKQSINAP